jgi:predicted glycogen debranching enzyme
MISFDSEICANFKSASSREWLETNGIGGFASGTISGANSRRYHGLLTAATQPPLGRVVMLSKFEEILTIGGVNFKLSANQYPNKIYPEGFRFLKNRFGSTRFRSGLIEIEGIRIEKKIFMVHGENTTVVQVHSEIRSRKQEFAKYVWN